MAGTCEARPDRFGGLILRLHPPAVGSYVPFTRSEQSAVHLGAVAASGR